MSNKINPKKSHQYSPLEFNKGKDSERRNPKRKECSLEGGTHLSDCGCETRATCTKRLNVSQVLKCAVCL